MLVKVVDFRLILGFEAEAAWPVGAGWTALTTPWPFRLGAGGAYDVDPWGGVLGVLLGLASSDWGLGAGLDPQGLRGPSSDVVTSLASS